MRCYITDIMNCCLEVNCYKHGEAAALCCYINSVIVSNTERRQRFLHTHTGFLNNRITFEKLSRFSVVLLL